MERFELILKLILAAGPSLIFIYFFVRVDIFHVQSSRRNFLILSMGSLSVLFAYVLLNIAIPLLTGINIFSEDLNQMLIAHFLAAGMLEEWSKLISVLLIVLFLEPVFRKYDIMFFTCSIGALFAALENTVIPQYFFAEVLAYRVMTAVPAHIFFSFVMSFFVIRFVNAKNLKSAVLNLFLAWMVPALIHGSYNMMTGFIRQKGNDFNIGSSAVMMILSVFLLGIFMTAFVVYLRKVLARLNDIKLFEDQS